MGDTGSLTNYSSWPLQFVSVDSATGASSLISFSVVLQVSYFKYTKSALAKRPKNILNAAVTPPLSKKGYHEWYVFGLLLFYCIFDYYLKIKMG
jgi:hypothetical protein